jgi:hypothetical protein
MAMVVPHDIKLNTRLQDIILVRYVVCITDTAIGRWFLQHYYVSKVVHNLCGRNTAGLLL